MSSYKVLRIINRLNLGGPTYNAAYLTKFIGEGYETTLLSGMKDESEAGSEHILEELKLKARYIKGMFRELNLLNDFKSYKTIRSIIREIRPDIVHTHAAKAGAIGRLAALHENVPVIVHTFHGHVFDGYFSPMKTYFFKLIERYLAAHSNAIIAISMLQKDDLVQKHKIVEPAKTVVIPLGFDLERFYTGREEKRQSFRQKHHIAEDEIAIGIIGRLVPIKNHKMFIQLISKITSENDKVKAFIIGDGELGTDLRAYATDLGFLNPNEQDSNINRLVFTSWITEVDEVCLGLDIVALTSHNEGTPVSLIEAQASGRVVVSTDVGGVGDTVADKESGFLSPNNDLDEMYKNIKKLIDDPVLRVKMGHQGEKKVKEQYSYHRLVSDTRKLYLSLLTD